MSSEIDGYLAGLEAVTDLNDRCGAVEEAAAQGQGTMLYELASALRARVDGDADPPWPYRALLDHIQRVLALTPGPVNAHFAARQATEGDGSGEQMPPSRVRRSASMLAAGQPVDHLAPLFAAVAAVSGPELDFLACLAQEMVLRHGQVEDPGVLKVVGRLRTGQAMPWLVPPRLHWHSGRNASRHESSG